MLDVRFVCLLAVVVAREGDGRGEKGEVGAGGSIFLFSVSYPNVKILNTGVSLSICTELF